MSYLFWPRKTHDSTILRILYKIKELAQWFFRKPLAFWVQFPIRVVPNYDNILMFGGRYAWQVYRTPSPAHLRYIENNFCEYSSRNTLTSDGLCYVTEPVRLTSNRDCIWLLTVFTMSIGPVPNATSGWIDFVSIAKIKCQNISKLTTVIHRNKKIWLQVPTKLPRGKYRTNE